MDEKPCCAADALRRIRQVYVGGVVVGIAMLEQILSDIKAMNLGGDKEIEDELLKRVKIYNYVPASAGEMYRTALMEEFRKDRERGG